MPGSTPSILVVDSDWDECATIASVLRQAGFAVVAAADRGARTALDRERFAAAVIGLPDGKAVEFMRQARLRQPDLKVLLVVDVAAMEFVDQDRLTLVRRPFDPRELLGCLFELVLRHDADAADPHHGHAAEFGIAAAKLACLYNRRATAAASGARRLTQDLTRQIGETQTAHSGLAAAMVGDCAVDPLSGAK